MQAAKQEPRVVLFSLLHTDRSWLSASRWWSVRRFALHSRLDKELRQCIRGFLRMPESRGFLWMNATTLFATLKSRCHKLSSRIDRFCRTCRPHTSCLGRRCLMHQLFWDKVLSQEPILLWQKPIIHFQNEMNDQREIITMSKKFVSLGLKAATRLFITIHKLYTYSQLSSFVTEVYVLYNSNF